MIPELFKFVDSYITSTGKSFSTANNIICTYNEDQQKKLNLLKSRYNLAKVRHDKVQMQNIEKEIKNLPGTFEFY